jgi:hypothetical protein
MSSGPTKAWKALVFALFLVTLSLAAVGCGGASDGEVSCTVWENTGVDGVMKICEEGSASVSTQLQQACNASASTLPPDAGAGMGMTFTNGPCSHVGALGGCQIVSSGTAIAIWYYQDSSGLSTSDDIKTMCAGIGATFLAP